MCIILQKWASLTFLIFIFFLPSCNSEDNFGNDAGTDIDADTGPDGGDDVGPVNADIARQVAAFVPDWAASLGKEALQLEFGGYAVKDAITQLELQFYNIDENGALINGAPDETQWFLDFGKENGIDVFLVLYNVKDQSFDWNLVVQAIYDETADVLLQNILDEVDARGYAGVDLDFESDSVGPYTDEDRDIFVTFVKKLSDELHARGKLLSVCSYFGYDHAPNVSWWSLLSDKVDWIHAMSLEQTWVGGPALHNYKNYQNLSIEHALRPGQMTTILPVWVDAWAGTLSGLGPSAKDNIAYILNCLDYPAGVTLFSLHHLVDHKTWQDADIWRMLIEMRSGEEMSGQNCESEVVEPNVVDDMRFAGTNLSGGLWYAMSDFWDRRDIAMADLNGDANAATELALQTSTKVWNAEKNYNLANEMGTWGDVGEGYKAFDVDKGNSLDVIIDITDPIDPNAATPKAYGAVMMEFAPRDCSLASDCWQIEVTGIPLDLSSYDKIIVGLKCEAGKKLIMGLGNNSDLAIVFGKIVECTGEYRDYELVLSELKPMLGATLEFDATDIFRLMLGYLNDGTPYEVSFSILGVALDRSVLALHGL